MSRRLIQLIGKVSFRQLLSNPRYELGRILGWFARRIGRVADVATHGNPQMPSWLVEEAVALAQIEPELLSPHGDTLHYQHYGIPVIPRPGEVYREVMQEIGRKAYSHVMIIPWLVPGGADRGALYHLKAWSESVSPAQILVITTEPNHSPWADKLPPGVRLVEFGRLMGELNFDVQVQLMIRLLVQLKPAVIHNINSRVAWQSIKLAGLALRQRSILFASLFCDDYNSSMVPVGYARAYLRECYKHIETVFCDNSVYPSIWSRELGVPINSFTVLPFPYDREWSESIATLQSVDRPRILWAGRLDRQKRPDVLAAIALKLPSFHFDVHGVAVISAGDPAQEQLRELPNVTMHGPFKRLEDVVRPDHVAYLHTSAWEGVPTILFDVAAAGLPIVAPDVGGIRDFVDQSWLVEDFEDVATFSRKLTELATSTELRAQLRSSQYMKLARDRSWIAFTSSLHGIKNYMGVA